MLTTLIYKSLVSDAWSLSHLPALVNDAAQKNTTLCVTGILLFNGSELFQVLEGEEDIIDTLYRDIQADRRHINVVELMRDFSAYRRFRDIGMRLFDLRGREAKDVTKEIINLSQFKKRPAPDERMFRFIETFIMDGGRYNLPAEFSPAKWALKRRSTLRHYMPPESVGIPPCQFALQPVVEPLSGTISSYEALIRSPSGGSPIEMFDSIPADQHYVFDLETKPYAFALGSNILKKDEKLAINLQPGSLQTLPDAVKFLQDNILSVGLRPEQIIIEVTETEVISCFEDFYQVLKEIRAAGIGLAIDDFGSGYSGLALLTRFQPDKIKIDIQLVKDIHMNGAKQAIVASIVRCCKDLEITVVAEGVEKMEEWCWLQSIGINLFQGFLFSHPCLNGVGDIQWPVQVGKTSSVRLP